MATLQFNTPTTTLGTYNGNLNIIRGTVVLNGGGAMGDLAAINVTAFDAMGLTVQGGTETIGSLSGGGTSGGYVSLASSLVTGGNNNSTTFSWHRERRRRIDEDGLGDIYVEPFGRQYLLGRYDRVGRNTARQQFDWQWNGHEYRDASIRVPCSAEQERSRAR